MGPAGPPVAARAGAMSATKHNNEEQEWDETKTCLVMWRGCGACGALWCCEWGSVAAVRRPSGAVVAAVVAVSVAVVASAAAGAAARSRRQLSPRRPLRRQWRRWRRRRSRGPAAGRGNADQRVLVATCTRRARSGRCHGAAAHRERHERRELARAQTRREVCVGAMQAAERDAALGRHFGERGAALMRRGRAGQVGWRVRRPCTG